MGDRQHDPPALRLRKEKKTGKNNENDCVTPDFFADALSNFCRNANLNCFVYRQPGNVVRYCNGMAPRTTATRHLTGRRAWTGSEGERTRTEKTTLAFPFPLPPTPWRDLSLLFSLSPLPLPAPPASQKVSRSSLVSFIVHSPTEQKPPAPSSSGLGNTKLYRLCPPIITALSATTAPMDSTMKLVRLYCRGQEGGEQPSKKAKRETAETFDQFNEASCFHETTDVSRGLGGLHGRGSIQVQSLSAMLVSR